jgi:hypothetical protein
MQPGAYKKLLSIFNFLLAKHAGPCFVAKKHAKKTYEIKNAVEVVFKVVGIFLQFASY